ncbi:hypothetical protein Q3G72_021236 [Acer saccharum]|nr:hypothetical protein Q3G72_021236 [Acer saccharum]
MSVNPESEHQLELMDDFLEMERLACLPDDADGDSPISANVTDARNCNGEDNASSDAAKGGHLLSEQDPSDVKSLTIELESDAKNPLLLKLYLRISTILESHSKEIDIGEVLEEIKCTMKDILGSLFQHLVSHLSEDAHITTSGSQILLDQHDKFVADSKTMSIVVIT